MRDSMKGVVCGAMRAFETRMKILLPFAVLAVTAGLAKAQDLAAGEKSFGKCKICHAVGPGTAHAMGPRLNGLDGRKPGTIPGYSYSEANKKATFTWSEATFKDYIKDPGAKIPGTRMFFSGIKDEKEAGDLWAYLKQFKSDSAAPPAVASSDRPATQSKSEAPADEVAKWEDCRVLRTGNGKASWENEFYRSNACRELDERYCSTWEKDNEANIRGCTRIIEFMTRYPDGFYVPFGPYMTRASAYKRRADQNNSMEDYDRSIADYTKVIELQKIINAQGTSGWSDGGEGSLMLDFMWRAEVYFKRGYHDKAIADWNTFIAWQEKQYAKNPTLVSTTAYGHDFRAKSYRALGDFARAAEDYTRSIALCRRKPEEMCHGTLGSHLWDRAEIYGDMGDHARELADWDELLKLKGIYYQDLRKRLDAYHTRPDFSRFIGHYSLAIKINPYDVGLHLYRAEAYEAIADWDSAVADYGAAIKIDDKDPDLYFARGNAFESKGNHAAALADFGNAISLSPNEPVYRTARARLLSAKGDIGGAVADLTEAIRINPKAAASHVQRGHAHRANGDLQKAASDFDQALKLNANSAPALMGRGLVRAARRDLDGALKDFDAAIRTDPNSATLYTLRAAIHAAKGDHNRAIADHSKALELEPADAYRHTARAWAFLKAGRLQEALKDANRALALEPKLASALATRDRIREALGRK